MNQIHKWLSRDMVSMAKVISKRQHLQIDQSLLSFYHNNNCNEVEIIINNNNNNNNDEDDDNNNNNGIDKENDKNSDYKKPLNTSLEAVPPYLDVAC